MFFAVDDTDPTPVYKQIVDGVREQVAQEVLKPGDSLPSVREMAGYLGINVNTVNRAYQILKEMGLIIARPARGSVIAPNAQDLLGSKENKAALLEEIAKLLQEATRLGFDKSQVIKMLKEMEQEK